MNHLLAILLAAYLLSVCACVRAYGHAPKQCQPYPRGYVPELVKVTITSIDKGKRRRFLLKFSDGTERPFIFEVPKLR